MAVSITNTANPNGVTASSNVATYSSVSIGAAATDRIIAVVVGTELASSTPSACTIDYGSGDTAMNAATGGNFGALYTQIFYLKVPTGTTATIKVTYSSTNPTNVQNHIAVYRVTGAKETLNAQGSDGSTDMDSTDRLTTGSITIPTNGGFIAIAAGATDTNTKTWANATENLDVDAGNFRFTTATRVTALNATAVTCTGTSNGEDGALSYVIFDPTISVDVTPGAESTTATIQDPTVSTVAHVEVEPTEIASTVSLQAPTVVAGVSVSTEVATQSLTWSIQAPTVAAEINASVSPTEQSVTITIQSPTVEAQRFVEVSPSEVTVAVNIQSPTVEAIRNASILADLAVATAEILAPEITAIINIQVAAALQELTGSIPTTSVQTGSLTEVASQVATITIHTPDILAQRNEVTESNLFQITATIHDPDIYVEQFIQLTPNPLSLAIGVNEPDIYYGFDFTPENVSAAINIIEPEVEAIINIFNVTIQAPIFSLVVALQSATANAWRRLPPLYRQANPNFAGKTNLSSNQTHYHSGKAPLYKNT